MCALEDKGEAREKADLFQKVGGVSINLTTIEAETLLKERGLIKPEPVPDREKYLPTEDQLKVNITFLRGVELLPSFLGAKSKSNGHMFSCKACGLKAKTKNVGSHVHPEWRQMQPLAERYVTATKPEVKAQKILVLWDFRTDGNSKMCLAEKFKELHPDTEAWAQANPEDFKNIYNRVAWR